MNIRKDGPRRSGAGHRRQPVGLRQEAPKALPPEPAPAVTQAPPPPPAEPQGPIPAAPPTSSRR
jgi:hypothetical protein